MERQYRYTLNLQTFAEEGPDDKGNPETPTPPATPEKLTDREVMIPKARFDEVNTSYKDVKSQLDKLLEAQKQADEAAKKEQGKYEELYSTAQKEADGLKSKAETFEQRTQALETLISEMLKAKLEALPEEYRDIIPDDLSPEAKLGWIEKATAKGLFGAKKASQPIGDPTNPPKNAADLEALNPLQLLQAGYGSK